MLLSVYLSISSLLCSPSILLLYFSVVLVFACLLLLSVHHHGCSSLILPPALFPLGLKPGCDALLEFRVGLHLLQGQWMPGERIGLVRQQVPGDGPSVNRELVGRE